MRFFKSRKNTVEKIKEATFELLSTKGYAQISMRDIAQKAKIALGQVTYYYRTKEKLIISVFDEMIETFISEMKQRINNSSDKLGEITRFFEEIYESEDKVYRVLIDFTAQSLWNEKLRERITNLFEKITSTIEEIYREYGVNKSEAEMKAKLYISNVYGTAIQKILSKENNSFNKIVDYQKSIVKKERKLLNAKANALL